MRIEPELLSRDANSSHSDILLVSEIEILRSAISDIRLEITQHCHLYVTSTSLSATPSHTATISTFESMLGCPIVQAQILRNGPRCSFKVRTISSLHYHQQKGKITEHAFGRIVAC